MVVAVASVVAQAAVEPPTKSDRTVFTVLGWSKSDQTISQKISKHYSREVFTLLAWFKSGQRIGQNVGQTSNIAPMSGLATKFGQTIGHKTSQQNRLKM